MATVQATEDMKTKVDLSKVKPGDELILGTSQIVTVSATTDRMVYIKGVRYGFNGVPYHHGINRETLRLPAEGEVAHLREQERLRKETHEDRMAKIENQPGYQFAVSLCNLGGYDATRLLNKYGSERCIAAWKALTDGLGE